MKSIKKIGRPASGRKGRSMHLYAEDDFIAALDAWRRSQSDLPNRSVAIRRLIESHPEIKALSQKGGKK